MFGCVLRVSGQNLRIPAGLSVLRVFPDGANIEITSAETEGFSTQVALATSFLSDTAYQLHELVSCDGFECGELDFGVEQEASLEKSFSFPPELAKLASDLGFTMRVSTYAVNDT